MGRSTGARAPEIRAVLGDEPSQGGPMIGRPAAIVYEVARAADGADTYTLELEYQSGRLARAHFP